MPGPANENSWVAPQLTEREDGVNARSLTITSFGRSTDHSQRVEGVTWPPFASTPQASRVWLTPPSPVRWSAPLSQATGVPPSSRHRIPAAPGAVSATSASELVVAAAGPEVNETAGGGEKYGSAAICRNDASELGELSTCRGHAMFSL